ncbi:hypothetical protein BST61_g4507 [Cercospora zeina]
MPVNRQKATAAFAALVVTTVVLVKYNPIRRFTQRMRHAARNRNRTRTSRPEAESSFQPEKDAVEPCLNAENVGLPAESQSVSVDSAGFTEGAPIGEDAARPEDLSQVESPSTIEGKGCNDAEPNVHPNAGQIERRQSQAATDPDAEQAARAKKHTIFYGEAETDYTRGPIRIVDAFDGVEDVSSLLLNLDLSAKIQAVICSRRDLQAAKVEAAVGIHQWLQLQSDVGYKIGSLKIRLSVAEDQSEIDPEEVDNVEAWRRELKRLEAFKDRISRTFSEIDAQVQWYDERLHRNHAAVEGYLEEAFVAARLVDAAPSEDDTGFDYHDFDVVYRDFCENQYVDQEGRSGDDGQASQDQEPALRPLGEIPNDQDPVWQQKRQAQNTWYEAHLELQKAQEAFDARTDDEWEDRQRAEEAQEDSIEWSLRWIQRGRELTRALIEAEEQHEKAREAAQEAGVEVAVHYQKSQFRDHASDGYGSEYERGGIAQAPRERILDWMISIPDAADPGKQESSPSPETDDGSCEYIGLSQSRSVIEDGAQRRQIDSWSKACGRRGV